MVRKLVSVDEGLHLPIAVQAQISADLIEDMETYVTDAQTASSSAELSANAADLARDEAVAAATSASAPTDEMFAGLLADTGSETYTTLRETFPGSYQGLYSARPTAASLMAGSFYYATDVKEQYQSNGVSWVVQGSGGQELGYASAAAGPFSTTSTTYVDVTGVTTTFVVGERPVEIKLDGQVANSSTTGISYLAITLDGVERGRGQSVGIVSNVWHAISVRARISGLTPGSTHTAKAQLRAAPGTTALAGGENTAAPISIQVVTL